MTFVAGNKLGKGRGKGVKNKKTLVKERVASTAVSVVASAVVAKPAKRKTVGAKATARPGISPKDLLLESMRAAWESVDALHQEAHRLDLEANSIAAVGSAPTAEVQAVVDRLRDQATKIREVAALQLEKAEELATKVAPYEHPKLANVDNRIRGNVLVEIAKF